MEKQILYSAVCRGYTVLASYQDDSTFTENVERHLTDFLCTFSTEVDTKTSFSGGRFKFHLMVSSGLVYCCGATAEAAVRLPFLFLGELHKRFNATHLPSRAYNAEEKEFDRDFKSVMREIVDNYNSGKSGDKIDLLRNQVADVKVIMRENIDKAIDRGTNLEALADQTASLESSSVVFRAQTTRVRRKMWLQNMKMWIIIGSIVVIVIIFIVLFATGVL